MSHIAVASAALIGARAVNAFLVLKQGATVDAAELQAHVKEKRVRLVTKAIHFVSSIPLTDLGKLDRQAARAPYWKGRARGIA